MLGLVDLPVQRERHTNWPSIPGSAIKGVVRDACRERISERTDLDLLDRYDDKPDKRAERTGTKRQRADATMLLNVAFGPPTAAAAEFAGSVSFTDARLLAFPVRSLAGVFAYVTCPAVLRRLERDLNMGGQSIRLSFPSVSETDVIVPGENCPCLIGGDKVVLEEFLFNKVPGSCRDVADRIAGHILPGGPAHEATRSHFRTSLVLVGDNWFNHFAQHATEIMARVRLDYETKTVAEGALFYEEYVPPETLFYSIVIANGSRAMRSNLLDASRVLQVVTENLPSVIQIGTNQTTGKGFCFTNMTSLHDWTKP